MTQGQIDTASLAYLVPVIRVGLGMSIGLVSGGFIAISPIASIDVRHTAAGISVVFMRWGLWAFAASFFIVSWCFLAAHTWIPVIAQAARPRRAALAAAAVCCSVMSPLLLRLMTNYYLSENLPWERAGIPGGAAASIAFSSSYFGDSRAGVLAALIALVILGTLVLIPQARRNARVPCEWVTLDPPIRVPWRKPAVARGTVLILSFYAAAAGTINPTVDPATWLGLNITSMALSPASPTLREVTRANPNLGDPLTDGQVYENLCEGYFGGEAEFDASISRQDLVIYSPDRIAWWRAYVLALPGDRVTSAGGGAPILIDGDQIDGRVPGDEETTSLQPLHLQVPPGKLWVTGLHWNLAAPGVYHLGEPGGGLIDRNWVIAFEPHADIGHLDWTATAPCGGA